MSSKIMNRNEILKAGLRFISEKWILDIIEQLRSGAKRFGEVELALKINPTSLTNRLKKLHKKGIISKQKSSENKKVVLYQLTEKGRKVLPILDSIVEFIVNEYKK